MCDLDESIYIDSGVKKNFGYRIVLSKHITITASHSLKQMLLLTSSKLNFEC